MKYETPELTPLPAAIDAIRASLNKRQRGLQETPIIFNEAIGAYADWE